MKHIRIVSLIVLTILIFASPAYSTDSALAMGSKPEVAPVEANHCPKPDLAITVCDSPRLVMEIQQKRTIEEENKELQQVIAELSTQISLLNQHISLLKMKLQGTEEMLETQKELDEKKIEDLNKQLADASKPRWKAMFASAGVGSILTMVLLLAAGL